MPTPRTQARLTPPSPDPDNQQVQTDDQTERQEVIFAKRMKLERFGHCFFEFYFFGPDQSRAKGSAVQPGVKGCPRGLTFVGLCRFVRRSRTRQFGREAVKVQQSRPLPQRLKGLRGNLLQPYQRR